MDSILPLLAPLRPDLVTLQECRQPVGRRLSVIWRGTDRNQDTGVVSARSALRLEPLSVAPLHRTVVPAVVHATQPFVLVGVWTDPPYNKLALDATSACVAASEGLPVVAAGDFNSSPSVRGQERKSLEFLNRMRDEVGLISAYHELRREAPGSETRATYDHLWKESAPFHLDYCFAPEGWVHRLVSAKVGTFKAWPQSDHRPLTIDLDL